LDGHPIRIYNPALVALCKLMHPIAYLLPAVLLTLKFVVKLLVGQAPTIPKTIDLVYTLPVDIVFMATSFAAAFTLSAPHQLERGLLYVFGLVIAAIVVTAMWRGSADLFYLTRYGWSAAIFVVNASFSAVLLYVTIALFPGTRI
jgi:hypothetical protein